MKKVILLLLVSFAFILSAKEEPETTMSCDVEMTTNMLTANSRAEFLHIACYGFMADCGAAFTIVQDAANDFFIKDYSYPLFHPMRFRSISKSDAESVCEDSGEPFETNEIYDGVDN